MIITATINKSELLEWESEFNLHIELSNKTLTWYLKSQKPNHNIIFQPSFHHPQLRNLWIQSDQFRHLHAFLTFLYHYSWWTISFNSILPNSPKLIWSLLQSFQSSDCSSPCQSIYCLYKSCYHLDTVLYCLSFTLLSVWLNYKLL